MKMITFRLTQELMDKIKELKKKIERKTYKYISINAMVKEAMEDLIKKYK